MGGAPTLTFPLSDNVIKICVVFSHSLISHITGLLFLFNLLRVISTF